MALNRRLGWLPSTQNNTAVLFGDYQESIQAKADLVRTAERFVHVEYFMMCRDATSEPFFAALLEVAARGVKVRVLFDHMSTFGLPGHKELLATFDRAGIEWRPMLPIQPLKGEWRRPDLRNHRKIVVVDGRTGFVGSQNMIDSSYHNKKHEAAGRHWHELTTRVEGPVVQTLNLVFASDWFIETNERLADWVQPVAFAEDHGELTCQIVPSGPGFPDENNLRLFNTLIYGAQHRLSITSPYFVPDDSLLYAITTAAQRGVAVELFVSERGEQFMVSHAQNSYYRFLLEAGVRIFQYPYPAVLHAKHFSVDDHTAVIGSSNMDIRSFNLDFEVSMMCTGPLVRGRDAGGRGRVPGGVEGADPGRNGASAPSPNAGSTTSCASPRPSSEPPGERPVRDRSGGDQRVLAKSTRCRRGRNHLRRPAHHRDDHDAARAE